MVNFKAICPLDLSIGLRNFMVMNYYSHKFGLSPVLLLHFWKNHELIMLYFIIKSYNSGMPCKGSCRNS